MVHNIIHRVFKKQIPSLLLLTVLMTALMSLIFLLLLAQGVFSHSHESQESFIPEHIVLIDTPLALVKEKLLANGIKHYLVGKTATVNNLPIHLFNDKNALIALDYSLFAFEFNQKVHMDIRCDGKMHSLQVLDIYSTSKGRWSIKLEPLECKSAQLVRQDSSMKLKRFKTNQRFSYFRYQVHQDSEAFFYALLIDKAKEIYHRYYTLSQYFNKSVKVSAFTQMHDQTLRSLFSLFFKKNALALGNQQAYKHMSRYSKMKMNISLDVQNKKHRLTLTDKIPFEPEIANDALSRHIIFTTTHAMKEMLWDKSFVFLYEKSDRELFEKAEWIDKSQIHPDSKNRVLSMYIAIDTIIIFLLLAMALFLLSFVKRIYRVHHNEIYMILLYGYKRLFTSTYLIAVLFVSYLLSLCGVYVLQNFFSDLFVNYYMDAINFSLTIYALLGIVFMLVLLSVVAFMEHHEQVKLRQGASRVRSCER